MLAHFVEDARAMSRAVCWGDAASVEDTVERGRKIRRGSIELKQAWVRRSRDRWWSGHTTNSHRRLVWLILPGRICG